MEIFDQNYGDGTLRSAVKYDLTNGGTVTLDMSDNSAGNPLVGFANISFNANPDDAAASMADERTDAYYPSALPVNALQIQLRDNCRIPWGPPVVVRYDSNVSGGRTTQRGNCAATPDGHWRFVFTSGHVSIRNGANAEVVAYDVTVPPTGWVILGVHNHASVKYANQESVVGLFDNVTYPTGGSGGTTTTSTTSTTSTTTTTAPTTTQPTTTSSTTTTAPTTTQGGGSTLFSESFATDQRSRFDFQLFTAANGDTAVPVSSTFLGEHNEACMGADTYRNVTGGQTGYPAPSDISSTGLSWWCAPGGSATGHMMTGLNTDGIAFLSFSPKQTFSSVQQVCWDQNANDMGGGKWLNVFVVPANDITSHGGSFSYAAASEIPFGGNNRTLPAGAIDFSWLRGSTFVDKWGTNGYTETMNVWKSYFAGQYGNVGGMVPNGTLEASPRFKICLNSGGNMVIQRPTVDGSVATESYAIGTTFPTGDVRVIFQDASYNPEKHDGFAEHMTWHFDNISVSSSSAVIPASYTLPTASAMLYCAL